MEKIGTVLWNWMESIAKKVVYFFLGLFHIELSEEKWNAFMQFVKFGMVGLSNTVISYIIYMGMLLLFRVDQTSGRPDSSDNIFILLASLSGFIVSVLNSFYWNNKYVFRAEDGQERKLLQAFGKMLLSNVFTGQIVYNILLMIWVNKIGLSAFVAPFPCLLVTIPMNFFLSKLWIFKEKKQQD